MKTLERDKRYFYYCLFKGKSAIEENGYKTGEFINEYLPATLMKANVSEGSGQTYIDPHGLNFNYAKLIRTSDKSVKLTEGTILFIDKTPEYDADKTPIGDYIVVKIIESINFIAYGIERIE